MLYSNFHSNITLVVNKYWWKMNLQRYERNEENFNMFEWYFDQSNHDFCHLNSD